jgi:hypothetical protein
VQKTALDTSNSSKLALLSSISPQAARMEQSFSADGGKSWEVNWICELSRAQPTAALNR